MTGAELRRRRQALSMSMQEFATQAGIGWTTLQRWETNKPRTPLGERGLDRFRLGEVVATLARLEHNGG